MIICKRCKDPKEKKYFPKDDKNKQGVSATCKPCKNEIRRLRYKNDTTYRNKQKDRQKRYNKDSLKRVSKGIKELSDVYIIASLKRGTDLTTKDIREVPELIKAKRQIIKNIRKCRQSRI